MERLVNIDRPGGFPLCAETLGVLHENSMMLTALLAEIPLDRRQAVRFGQYLLVCDQNANKRVVKAGAINAASLEQCKLVFQTENHSVYDDQDNEIADVWSSETAVIEDEDSPGAQWRIVSFGEVLGPVWQDRWQEFEAGLPGMSIDNGEANNSSPVLYGNLNLFRSNSERLQMRFAFMESIKTNIATIINIPLPVECPDGVRMIVDVSPGSGMILSSIQQNIHYPAHAYIANNHLRVEIGRCMMECAGLSFNNGPIYRAYLFRVNGEVML